MNDLIKVVVAAGILLGSGAALRKLGNEIRVMALTKASEGLPSLVKMNTTLHRKRSN